MSHISLLLSCRERERERRLEARDAHGGKRSKLTRDRERDISEKIALGQVRRSCGSFSALVVAVHATFTCLGQGPL